MESKHKNIGQLDGNNSMDSDICCEYCVAKGEKEDADDDYVYFCNQNCQTYYTKNWKQNCNTEHWILNTKHLTLNTHIIYCIVSLHSF